MEWLDEIFFPEESQCHQEDPEIMINREIDLYLSADHSTERSLKWWKDRESSYPHVAKVAKSFSACLLAVFLVKEFSAFVVVL